MFPIPQKKIFSEQNHRHAILYIVFALLLYVLQDTLVKALPSHYSIVEIIFFRSLFSLLPIFVVGQIEKTAANAQGTLLKTTHWGGHILRAGMMFLSLLFYLYACRHIPLADVYTLSYTSPLFMTLLAVPLLNERITVKRLIAILCGFLGVVFILNPGGGMLNIAGLSAVISGFLTAFAAIWGRRLSFSDSNTLIVLMYSLMGLAGTFFLLPFVWIEPTLTDLFFFMAIGLTGGFAQYGFTHAYRLAPVTTLAPFDYSGLVWAVPIGYLIWNDLPTFNVVIGGGVIILAGLYVMIQDRRALKQFGAWPNVSHFYTQPD